MSQNNNEINFLEFYKTFYELTPEQMFIICRTLIYMEHINDPNFSRENYKDSINFLRNQAKLTLMDLCKIIARKNNFNNKKAYEQYIFGLKEGIRSAISRTSRKSQYFNEILEILKTDEFELEMLSDYYNNEDKNGNLMWLYNSVSDRNRHMIHYLMDDLILLNNIQINNDENVCEEDDLLD